MKKHMKPALDKSIEQDPNSQSPKRGKTQSDRDRQNGAASTLKQELARMGHGNMNSINGGGRGRRGTSDDMDA